MKPLNLFVETSRKKTFAGALDWPGWVRWGATEETAIESLLNYRSRYLDVLANTNLDIGDIKHMGAINVIERCEGNATTAFGAPAVILEADKEPMGAEEYRRSKGIMRAGWGALDSAMIAASGKELRKGPRGGGRDLEKMVEHVLAADGQYLSKMACKHKRDTGTSSAEQLAHMREALTGALDAAERGELPEKGPRGGLIWPPGFFVRRVVWHTLDHAWEIEDRIIP